MCILYLLLTSKSDALFKYSMGTHGQWLLYRPMQQTACLIQDVQLALSNVHEYVKTLLIFYILPARFPNRKSSLGKGRGKAPMFSELLYLYSHLSHNRSVRTENCPHFAEEKIKIHAGQVLAKVTLLVLAKQGRNSGVALKLWHFPAYCVPSSDITG